MPGFLVTAEAQGTCPHAGTLTVPPAQARVTVGGQPVAVQTDIGTVAGCPFQIPFGVGTKPQPCVTAKFTVAATKIMVGGVPVLLQDSTGLCSSAEQIPQGPPTFTQTQLQVKGT
jgi:hypothetical protein